MSEESAKNFALEWNERGDEKSDTQKFWWTLLRDVFDIDKPEKIFDVEKRVKIKDQTKFIDGYIARTKVLIEQKSLGVDLNRRAGQSDGEYLTPFEQAKRYAEALPYSERPRWIVVCNFAEFHIYDLAEMNSFDYLFGVKKYLPNVLKLENFRHDFSRLKFIVDPNAELLPEVKISRDAAEVIKIIYDAFKKSYVSNKIDGYKNSLDKLCTRLVFCFYAAYAKIFDSKEFFAAIKDFDALQKIFDALNTPPNLRGNLDDEFKNFPYVNGGLFSEKILFPTLNRFKGNPFNSIRAANSPEKFNWRKISPTIFGAMFESILSSDERRAGGMHYTSPENIHKVIDPLFLDDLHEDFRAAKSKRLKNRAEALIALQDKIAALKFFDPACGSGNFLTETYMSLRRLENNILAELRALKFPLPAEPVKVSINQFCGIEINDFAVAVAQTALWIAENQMIQESSWIVGHDLKELPLKNYATIVCNNALHVDWKTFAPNVDYIIGNPPFGGRRYRSAEQQAEVAIFFNYKDVDYVACWFKKAVDFMHGNKTRAAFVATNSICQGEQVKPIWKNFFAEGIHIDFARRTFKWLSDSDNMAHVHCVVVGFSHAPNNKRKIIFDGDKVIVAQNINAYLVDAPNVFIEMNSKPVQDFVPPMRNGNVPLDGDALKIEAEDYKNFIRVEPAAKKYIKRLIGGRELLYNNPRYVLWLAGVSFDEIKKLPLVAERVERCKENRLSMSDKASRKLAKTPTTFRDTFNPAHYIALPMVSSENRRYVPMAYFDGEIIPTNQVQIIPDAEIYHFGVLTSSIHMAWMRTVAGRLESSYRYSKDVVYNNFVWCEPTARQRRRIEETAQEILKVRANFPDWTFAKLYDEETMPQDLRDAHKENDMAVALAYGFDKFLEDEPRIVAELMRLYKRLTA